VRRSEGVFLSLVCVMLLLMASNAIMLNIVPEGPAPDDGATRGPGEVSVSGWVKDEVGAAPPVIFVGAFYQSNLSLVKFTSSYNGTYKLFVPENGDYLLLQFTLNNQTIGGYSLHGYFPESASLNVTTSDIEQNFTISECYEVILEGYDHNGLMISEKNFTPTKWTTNTSDSVSTAKSEFSVFSGCGNGAGFNAPVVMLKPDTRRDIWFQWEHPGFGRVNLEMDNGSAGYGGPAQGAEVVQVNYDLARSLNTRMTDKQIDYLGKGYSVSQETNNWLAYSTLYLANAQSETGMTRVDWADKCVNASLWALEGLEMDRTVTDIETNRKGNLTVRVVDETGYPVPNATVSIEQTSHDFLFGVFDQLGHTGEDVYQQLLDIGVNFATAGFYWFVSETTEGQPNYDAINDTVGVPRLVEMGYKVKAHALIYLMDIVLPDYVKAKNFTELNQTVYDHIYALVHTYRDHIDIWNVVNEAHGKGANYFNFTKDEMLQIIKTGCKAIRDADSTSEILVNNGFNWFAEQLGGTYVFGEDNYTQAIHEFNDWLTAEGLDFDIVGQQMYEGGYSSFFEEAGLGGGMAASTFDLSVVSEILDTLEKYGKPIHITEQSVSGTWNHTSDWPGVGYWHKKWDEQTQADFLTYFYTLVFSKPSAEAITWWNLNGSYPFMKNGALFTADLQPKPVFYALADFIANHTTNTTGATDWDGNATLRGYGGDYNITVEKDGVKKSVPFHITEQQDQFIQIQLDGYELLPDLAIASADVQFNVSMPSATQVKMDITVHNIGERVGQNVDVKVLLDAIDSSDDSFQVKTIPSLNGSSSDLVSFDWDLTQAIWGVNFTVQVDPVEEIKEVSETNNNISFTFPELKGMISGKVVINGTNDALEGASVTIRGPLGFVLSTDANGEFSVPKVLTGEYRIIVIKPDYHLFNDTFIVTDWADEPLTIGLDPIMTGTVIGYVDALYGDCGLWWEALPGAEISLVGTDLKTLTNETGWYILENVTVGFHTIEASHQNCLDSNTTVYVFGNRTTVANLTLREDIDYYNLWIDIFVFDEEGNPIENAMVTLRNVSLEGETDVNGQVYFTLGGWFWPIGNTLNISITAEGYYDIIDYQPVKFGQDTLMLNYTMKRITTDNITDPVIYDKVGTVEGYVVDANTGEKLSGVTIIVVGTNITATSDADGSYTLTLVPEGRQLLEVTTDEYGLQEFQVFVTNGSTVNFDIEVGREPAPADGEESRLGVILGTLLLVVLMVVILIVVAFSWFRKKLAKPEDEEVTDDIQEEDTGEQQEVFLDELELEEE